MVAFGFLQNISGDLNKGYVQLFSNNVMFLEILLSSFHYIVPHRPTLYALKSVQWNTDVIRLTNQVAASKKNRMHDVLSHTK